MAARTVVGRGFEMIFVVPLKIIGGGLEAFWWRFGGVLVDLFWLPCLVVVCQTTQRSRHGPESHIPARTL
jgi:hypothetical protein